MNNTALYITIKCNHCSEVICSSIAWGAYPMDIEKELTLYNAAISCKENTCAAILCPKCTLIMLNHSN